VTFKAVLALSSLSVLMACGATETPLGLEDPAPIEDPIDDPVVTLIEGVVIASDTLDITPVLIADVSDPKFLVPYQWQNNLPSNLEPTAGKLLVFSLREITDPDADCGQSDFDASCASMVVIENTVEEPGLRPGRLAVDLGSGPTTFFMRGNFTLTLNPEPT
jgi:hypothetical protein